MPAPPEMSWIGSSADPDDEGFFFEWPLWGLSLDRPPGVTNGLYLIDSGTRWRLPSTLLYQPTWAEWTESERSTIVREAAWGKKDAGEAIGQDESPPPLAVLARIAPAPMNDYRRTNT